MKRFLMPLLVLGLFGASLFFGESVQAALFVVNSNNDANDGACNDRHCSLREAIIAANANSNADTINFLIPIASQQIISPTSALPVITNPVIINGYSQPQTSQNTSASGNNAVITVILDGLTVDGRTNNIVGLELHGGNSTVMGLNIRRFRSGISLPSRGTNIIRGNFLNVNTVGLFVRSPNNLIGGTTAANRNVISSNSTGINIDSATTPSTIGGNVVQGNFIGTNFTGSARAGNTTGLRLFNAPNNIIGGTISGARNIISGNIQDGVSLNSRSSGNRIEGNFIGTNLTASAAIANGRDGVVLIGSSNNIIGGTASGARNIISGNTRNGVTFSGVDSSLNRIEGNFIGTNLTASAAIANGQSGVQCVNAAGNTIGGSTVAARNIISGNGGSGVGISLVSNVPSGNKVEGNFIGTNATGSTALANGFHGVSIFSAAGHTIGGTATGARNIISGNTLSGIHISTDSSGSNKIEGNFIGTNATGSVALANGHNGVEINNSHTNIIGGTTTGARNIISGNIRDGVRISGSSSNGNFVQGNFIGTNLTASAAIANGVDGVDISDAPNNRIGGSTVTARNIISGNFLSGVRIDGATASNNQVQGNFIGTNADGSAALGNSSGVLIFGANSNLIGGATSARNIISGNRDDGVRIIGFGTNSSANVVAGNFIGLNAAGTAAIANDDNGVTIDNASRQIIGSNLNTGIGNVISGNRRDGVVVLGAASTGSVIGENLIGTNPDRSASLGNGGNGILLQNASGILNRSNTIAGNPLNGVLLDGSSGCELNNNSIGIRTTGGVDIVNGGHGILARNCTGIRMPFGNAISRSRGDGLRFEGGSGHIVENNSIFSSVGHGISFDGTTNCRVGGGTALPNRITFNGGDGIFVASNCNGININAANNIFSNGGLGIDLGPDGPTPNDVDDADGGANQLQNFPVLSVDNNANGLPLRANLNAQPNTAYSLAFFQVSAPPDPSGFGEGGEILGAQSVTTGDDGNATFIVTLPLAQNLDGRFITATATDPQGNTSEFSQAVQVPTGNMTLAVTDAPDPVTAGEILTYRLTITNNGALTRLVQLTNTLPPGVPLASPPVSNQGTPVVSGQRVTVNFGPLEPGGTITVTIRVRPPVSATITNIATISGNFADSDPADNTVRTSTTVLPRVDLSLTGTAPTSIDAGDTLTYTLRVKNLGRRDANSVSLINQLPSDVELLGATPTATSQAGRLLTFNLGPLAVDAERTIAIRVRPTTGGRLINVARVLVGTGQSDPDSSNNVIQLNTMVTGCARDAGSQVTITRGPAQLSDFAACFFAGACRLRQVVTVKNTGTTSLSGPLSLVLDNLTSGMTLVNASGTTTCNAPLGSPYVQISPTALAPGASVEVTLEFETSSNENVTYDPRVLYGLGER